MIKDQILAAQIANCTNCRLATVRGSGLTVPADPGEKYQPGGVAIFLEAPGADEEKYYESLPTGENIGRPLNGRSGTLMDLLLRQASLSRGEVVVLNRIRCRPPRNRIDDYPDAVSQCDSWVKKELEAYAPSVVILSGNTALKSVFGASASITSLRGVIRQTSEKFPYGKRIFIPTFHPAYALRNGGINSPIAKDIISDLKLAKELMTCGEI